MGSSAGRDLALLGGFIGWVRWTDAAQLDLSHRPHTAPASPLRALRALAADLLPIAVLIDELKHEDSQSRLRSVQRLGDIAEALGAIRTREELIPFLSNDMDDDDEVLREFASQLGSLLDAVGGAPHAMTLLVPLEQLASVEDTDVREKASQSIATLARAVSSDMVVSDVVPLLQVRAR